MAYPPKYVRYLNLPVIPDHILSEINYQFDQYEKKVHGNNYVWSDSFNQTINDWCKKNICEDMYFAFQIISGDLGVHKDKGTKVKLIYLINAGGDSVYTEFWNDDQTDLLQKEILVTHRWHIMKVDTYHRVVGVEPNKIRFSITGRIFE